MIYPELDENRISVNPQKCDAPHIKRHCGLDPQSPNRARDAEGIPGQARDDENAIARQHMFR